MRAGQRFFLRKERGELCLKTTHMYYTQVQMEMAVTGCSWADFVVFTISEGQHGLFVQRVKFDADFWRACSGVLRNFFRRLWYYSLLLEGWSTTKACYHSDSHQAKCAFSGITMCFCRIGIRLLYTGRWLFSSQVLDGMYLLSSDGRPQFAQAWFFLQ